MSSDIIKTVITALILVVIQVMVLGNIHLFGCATPLLYIYVLIHLQRNAPRWMGLVLGFGLGIISDIFSNTPGVGTASLTFMGFVQPYILQDFLSRDSAENLVPSFQSMTMPKYLVYVLVMTLLFCIIFFSLETFSPFQWRLWALLVAGSTIITYIFIITIDIFRKG